MNRLNSGYTVGSRHLYVTLLGVVDELSEYDDIKSDQIVVASKFLCCFSLLFVSTHNSLSLLACLRLYSQSFTQIIRYSQSFAAAHYPLLLLAILRRCPLSFAATRYPSPLSTILRRCPQSFTQIIRYSQSFAAAHCYCSPLLTILLYSQSFTQIIRYSQSFETDCEARGDGAVIGESACI